jgi:predicted RNA-binding protein with RPS1 domain
MGKGNICTLAKKFVPLALLLLLIAGIAAGCSAAESSHKGASEEALSESPAKDSGAPAAKEASAADSKDVAGSNNQEQASADTADQAQQSASVSPAMEEGFNRKLIYKASLTMEVEDYAAAQTAIRDVIHLTGGYILQFADHKTMHEEGGNFTIKIPAGGFFSFISELEKLQPLSLQRTVHGSDVTEEYVDLTARLKAKQVVEARLLAFLEKASKVDELVKFSNELERVQEEIERIKGRIRYLDQNVAFSTVELRMYERLNARVTPLNTEADKNVFERAWSALHGSAVFIGKVLEGVVVVAAGALPIVILLGAVAIPVIYFYRKRRRPPTNIDVK